MKFAVMTFASTCGVAVGLLAGTVAPASAMPVLAPSAAAPAAATPAEKAYYYYRRYGYYRPYYRYRYYRPYYRYGYYRPYYYRPGIRLGIGGFGVRLF